jgi:ABC-type multidrug transport system ATPase subunit
VDDRSLIRGNLGFCQQHDVLFESLTCREHLILASEVKGVPQSEVDSQIEEVIEELLIFEESEIAVKNLSRGMRRRVSIGIALIGQPKLIIMDEPSAGLDQESK